MLAAGGAAVGVRLVLRGADVAGEADVRMAAAPVRGEVAVADPDEPGARWRLRCASSFSRKPVMTPAW